MNGNLAYVFWSCIRTLKTTQDEKVIIEMFGALNNIRVLDRTLSCEDSTYGLDEENNARLAADQHMNNKDY